MKWIHAVAASLAVVAGSAPAYDRNDWPTRHVFADGTDLGLSANFQYDVNRFSHDTLPDGTQRFEDAEAFKRREFGFYVRKKGIYDAGALFDFQTRQWQDVYARLQTTALGGAGFGAIRIGYTKTPVGFEGVTSSRATPFIENALPVQAIFEGRRIGIDWAFERPAWILNAGWYAGDLHGDNDGRTLAARAAWTPLKGDGAVLHLGLSASREQRDDTIDGRGVRIPASARLRARPEAALTDIRLVDSGTLGNVDDIERFGAEVVWIGGPWSVQGEVLGANVRRDGSLPDYAGAGWYVFGSWAPTGESRSYSAGNTGNVKPKGRYGALELLLRYSSLDLDDGAVRGGRQRDWTLGANWILDQHFKLQANYIRADSERGALALDPHILTLRLQAIF